MGVLDKKSALGNPDWDKDKIEKKTDDLIDEAYDLIKRLYAENKQSVLLVLQGMDASGKDGLTRTLFKKVSPAWVNVQSFKKPSDEEMAHNYLWRIHKHTPKKGMITVFNRSHYEDILVPSVYGYIDKKTIENRYEQINQFEKYLEENGIKVLKFYLNVSKEKQLIKLNERIDTPEKHWKHSDGDWETREHWEEFMKVYEQIFQRCNDVPWHFIPCDRNWEKLYVASQILIKTLKEMNPQFPNLESKRFQQ